MEKEIQIEAENMEEVIQIENVNLLESTLVNLSMGFICKVCDFVGKNSHGLKTHVKKKHKGN